MWVYTIEDDNDGSITLKLSSPIRNEVQYTGPWDMTQDEFLKLSGIVVSLFVRIWTLLTEFGTDRYKTLIFVPSTEYQSEIPILIYFDGVKCRFVIHDIINHDYICILTGRRSSEPLHHLINGNSVLDKIGLTTISIQNVDFINWIDQKLPSDLRKTVRYAYSEQIHKFGEALIDRNAICGPNFAKSDRDVMANFCSIQQMEKIIKLFEAIIQRSEFYTVKFDLPIM